MPAGVLLLVVAALLGGCTAPPAGSDSHHADETARRHADAGLVRPGQPRISPSGEFVARVEPGPARNGVPTWVVVLTDRTGREVFRDSDAHSSRPGVAITWLTGEDELWLVSGDTGTSYLQQDADGWSKERPRPGHFDQDVPPEIRELAGR